MDDDDDCRSNDDDLQKSWGKDPYARFPHPPIGFGSHKITSPFTYLVRHRALDAYPVALMNGVGSKELASQIGRE